jgi:hypothetical protein
MYGSVGDIFLWFRQWSKQIQGILLNHQDSMVIYIKSGYDELTVEDRYFTSQQKNPSFRASKHI